MLYGCAALAQTAIEVGAGAPTQAIQQAYVMAYLRNGFNLLVNTAAPAVGTVKKFGSAGLVQEFQDPAKTAGVRYALIKANSAVTPPTDGTWDVFQVYSGLYAYYSTLAVATVGYPNTDTKACPTVANNACTFITLDKNYALFSYTSALYNGQNFSVRDPYYTKWLAGGGISMLGPANNPEQTITSPLSSVTATYQTFGQGAVFNITSGSLTGTAILVRQPVYSIFTSNGGPAGLLGLPMADEVVLANGLKRQTFEGGAVDYDPATLQAALRPAVASVVISGASAALRLNLGDSAALQATALSSTSLPLTDRAIAWTTSDGLVATVSASGVVTAVGGGTARIVATSEGKSSAPLTVFVTAPCCAIGEGAPTAAIAQMFQEAVARNRLNVKLPAAAPVTMVAGGYEQQFLAADPNSSGVYLVAASAQSSTAWVVTGAILARYSALGGAAGSLGFPVADATVGGRQLFAKGALAGSPVGIVAGAFLTKWAALGYETGTAGSPSGDPVSFLTFTGVEGSGQAFSGGLILSAVSAPYAGKTYFVTGPILAKYLALGGAKGELGMALTDEYALSGRRQQDFEGGSVSYVGAEDPAVALRNRQPAVSITPASVVAGDRVRVAVGGFSNGATLKVSVTGQPDFTVATDTGSYVWDFPIAAAAKSQTITVTAVDATAKTSATGSFTVIATADANLTLIKVQGDAQAGAPGARLPLPVRIRVVDDSGNPVAGIAVNFAGSPGVQIEGADTATNQSGEASAWLRLPRTTGIALATANAAHQFVTFSAQMAASALGQFPKLSRTVNGNLGGTDAAIAQKGSLLAAAASMLRYYQLRGDVPAPNGLADVATLNQYLGAACVIDARAGEICDGYLQPLDDSDPVLNLWRLPTFAGGTLDISIEQGDENTIRDLVATGSPVLLALAISANGIEAGSHFVVAIGVGADGSIQIYDPDPVFARATLADYLLGFQAGGAVMNGVVTGAARLVPGSAPTAAFLVSSTVDLDLTSAAGVCGTTFALSDRVAPESGMPARAPVRLRLRACTGAEPAYQLDLLGTDSFRASLTDLASPGVKLDLSGAGAVFYRIARLGGNWGAAPLAADVSAGSIVNAASYTAEIARGGLLSIFGVGLYGAQSATTVAIGGEAALVTLSTPFRVNARVPQDLAAGEYLLHLESAFGIAEQTVQVLDYAPAILEAGTLEGVVLDASGAPVSAANPALRGKQITIYTTGLGAVSSLSSGAALSQPVTVVIRDQAVTGTFSGFVAGLIGVYPIRAVVPSGVAPGVAVPVLLRQAGRTSNTIQVAIQ